MKLSVTQENLAKSLGVVGRVVSGRTSLPVLSNVLISTDSKRLRLAATNLEIGINYWIGCKVEHEGSVTVPARLLSEFVASLPGGNIEMNGTETSLAISTPHYNSTINGISAEEFPQIPEVVNDPVLTLAVSELREAINQAVVAASLDEGRPVLAGIHWYTEDKQLFLVATDSYRLAERSIGLSEDPSTPLSIIVPTRTMQELARILADAGGDLSVYLNDGQVMFRLENIELTSRLIEGKFPDYRQIIPTTNVCTITLDTAEFSRIVKVSSLFARENAGSIRLQVQAEGQVTISSSAAQVGENSSSAECEVDGDDGEISLNSRFLSEALSVVKTKRVSFTISGKLSACIVRPAGEDAEAYLHVIMPLRT